MLLLQLRYNSLDGLVLLEWVWSIAPELNPRRLLGKRLLELLERTEFLYLCIHYDAEPLSLWVRKYNRW